MNPKVRETTSTIATTAASGRRRTLLALLASILAALFALATPGTANAYTISQRSNVPLMPTIYQVQGAHYDSGSAVTGPMWRPWVYQSGPVVSRTTPSGSQSVRVTYTVQRWNGSQWAFVTYASGSTTIAAGAVSAKLPNLSVLPTAGAGYYRVQLALTWTSPLGAVQGSLSVAMSQAGDYRCTTSRTCWVGSGYVYIGS